MNFTTALRRSFERARSLDFEQQIQECADLLQNPELVAGEVIDAYRTIATLVEQAKLEAPDAEKDLPDEHASAAAPTLVEKFIWETRELMVLGDKCSFTCLATNVEPLRGLDSQAGRLETGLSVGLDYIGITCDSDAVVVLGAVQAPGDVTAYPLLLRLLACLTEMSPAAQIERINRLHLRGVADPTKPFDLNLVLWDDDDPPQTTPLSQLTRDLAEKVKQGLQEDAGTPANLRDIVCLRMNANRFDGRMRFDWRA